LSVRKQGTKYLIKFLSELKKYAVKITIGIINVIIGNINLLSISLPHLTIGLRTISEIYF
jgi:hypothetical protein